MCFYYSPHFDQNIWRRASSLTGERTKKDPAFKGFRQSSSRLKQASPIASSLYKLVPSHIKQYPLYRTLTGKAINMLKEGIETPLIIETLKKEYIDPLLETPKDNSGMKLVEQPAKSDPVDGMRDFTSFPQTHSGMRKTIRTRRFSLVPKIREDKSEDNYYSYADSNPPPQSENNIFQTTLFETAFQQQIKPRNKTTTGLIYLGRLPECKKLKVWLRPSVASDFGLGK
jgi:hypothetical protein